MTDSAETAADLLQTLIRNRCVNDGTPGSGQEHRSAATLRSFLEESGAEVEVHESAPGRANLVARIEGMDPSAPSLGLCGHLDVVPADAGAWSFDPFGGERRDGVVWGRGAVDMLNQTTAMAVAFAGLLRSGFRPKGDLVLFLPADEEAGGTHGAEWMLDHHSDLVRVDYLIGEGGGFRLPVLTGDVLTGDVLTGDGMPADVDAKSHEPPVITVMVGEKGPLWRELHFQGTAGHGSIPYGSDNAVAKASMAIARLSRYETPAVVDEIWRSVVEALAAPDALKERLVSPSRIDDALAELHDTNPTTACVMHACTHTTISPNVVHGGVMSNVVPHHAAVKLDIRMLPGQTVSHVDDLLREGLGEHFDEAVVEDLFVTEGSISPAGSPLWDSIERVTSSIVGPCHVVPWVAPFSTDARFYRAHGSVAYGFTLHDETTDLETFATMFHGHDERVSVRSLELAVEAYDAVVRDFLG